MKIEELPQNSLVQIIDADSISYVISHELNKWDDQVDSCDVLINNFVAQLLLDVNCTHYVGYLGGVGNFRYELAKTKPYKGNRSELSDRDKKWKEYINEYLVQNWDFQRVNGIEADDAVSITANLSQKLGINYIINSNDKDVDQVTGNHYSMNKRQFYFIDEYRANYSLFKQMILGDTTDNIPGLPGKGKAFLDKLGIDPFINSGKDMLDKLVELYSPLGNEYFHEQLALLGLLTESDSLIPNIQLKPDQQELQGYISKHTSLFF